MKTLIEKIAAYKNATQSLIEKTEEFENFVKENVPFEFWKQFGLKYFGSGQSGAWHISINNKCIPATTDKFNKCFYWGGDFNYNTNFVSGKELIEWSKGLNELTNKAEAFINNLTEQAINV